MSFSDSIEIVLKHEGLFSDHPSDQGGPTKYGITLQTLSFYRKKPTSAKMVQDLTLTEALKIYEELFWKPLMLDQIKDQRLQTILLDQAINRGTVTAVRTIQRALGVKIDGLMGPHTLSAINSSKPLKLGLKFIFAAQTSYLAIAQDNPQQMVFLPGWINRTHDLIELLLEDVV